IQCNYDSITNTVKLHQNDPFKNTIVKSQTFDIDSKQDNVIEGEKGTVLVFPKGCFKNSNGKIVDNNVKIELSEALSLEEMLLPNLATTAGGRLRETDGMSYSNGTANRQLLISHEDNPSHSEIPTSVKQAGTKVY